MENTINQTIEKKKNIALIAHDGKKDELLKWCAKNKDALNAHFLCGTGTTAHLISDNLNLPIHSYNSGPLGGDQQIGSRVVEGSIDFIIFFSDPLCAQPHDPDIKALLRIAIVYDIPIATNRASADFMMTSELMHSDYIHEVQDFNAQVKRRFNDLKQ